MEHSSSQVIKVSSSVGHQKQEELQLACEQGEMPSVLLFHKKPTAENGTKFIVKSELRHRSPNRLPLGQLQPCGCNTHLGPENQLPLLMTDPSDLIFELHQSPIVTRGKWKFNII